MEGHHKLFWGRKRRSVVEGQKEKGAIFLDGWRRIVMRGAYLGRGGHFGVARYRLYICWLSAAVPQPLYTLCSTNSKKTTWKATQFG